MNTPKKPTEVPEVKITAKVEVRTVIAGKWVFIERKA
jgi:hypothetical protein